MTATAIPAAVKDFELTWVVYDPADPLGAALALITLSPVFIMVMYATLVVFQRDLDSIALLVGQLLNEAFNQVLKRSIRQRRPDGARMGGNGMPSAHSQFIAFFAAYVAAYTFKRMSAHRQLEKQLTVAGTVVLAAVVCYSRVRLGYHSVEQVIVGAAVGAVAGLVWHAVVAAASGRLFPVIARSTVAQALHIRDISHIPDLIVYQHQLCHAAIEGKEL